MKDLAARLGDCYTGAVHDVLRGMGHEHVVMPPSIKPLDPSIKVAGPAWTVSGHIDRTLSRDDTLLGWCTLLGNAPSGHVVVCQPHNHEVSLMGELSAQTLAARGVLGFIVDGGSRDTDLVIEQRFPVFASFLTPSDIVQRWTPDRYGAPIDIGGVTIRTGDFVLGDRDGVVVIPYEIADSVVAETENVVATESDMRRALIGGMDPVEAYRKFGKF
ncbi:MAG TPA: RraA family protein [Casimicrobiaceae bacterium]|nr:RraA family protein [Casimicrobiaceae bacterium]